MLPPVTVIADPARMLPTKTEFVNVTASAANQNTLSLHSCPPGITTEKLVPVRAPVPLVPIRNTHVSAGEPASVNTPPVSVTATSKQ